ncbi:MAG: hypothetical protein KJ915_11270 [Candidatus Omnitrophica bacterium]|nr:hypothetical protein [Candidatus Omnitrophota bacterium]
MKKIQFIIIITLILSKVCFAQPELNTTLAPQLAIETKVLHNSITYGHIHNEGYFSLIVEPDFLMHIRPFELLCDLSRVISEKEGISIELNILDEYKQRVSNIIYPLEEISAQFSDNDLHVYYEDIKPLIEGFTGSAHGLAYKAKKHYFEVIIHQKLFQPAFIPSKHILLFFDQFFKNKLTRENGSIIDISFDSENILNDYNSDNDYQLNPDDFKYLTTQLGDKDFLPPLSSSTGSRVSLGTNNKALEGYWNKIAIKRKISSKTNSESIEKSI